MSKPASRSLTVSLVCFAMCFIVLILLFFFDGYVIEYIPSDKHILFRRIMGIIVFLLGSTGIFSGIHHLLIKFKLI